MKKKTFLIAAMMLLVSGSVVYGQDVMNGDTVVQATPDSIAADSIIEETLQCVVPGIAGASTMVSSISTGQTQLVDKYRVMNNAQGYAAEDANAMNDIFHGHRVISTGQLNESDGPDRIVDGTKIQTKYGKSAEYNVSTSFDKVTGMYRYSGQLLEVPKDQYEEAINLMRQKIAEGKVPGYTNPDDAVIIVKQGKYTYEQACKIAKAGTIESIKFDAITGAVTCTCAAGLSFITTYAMAKANGTDTYDAIAYAGKSGGEAAGVALVSHVGTQQFFRMQSADKIAKTIDSWSGKIVRQIQKTQAGNKILTKVVSSATGKELTGKALSSAARRLVDCNIVSAVVTTAAVTSVDVYKGVQGEKTWDEVGKDAVSNVGGTVGGSAGAWGGAAIGTLICPGVGTAIGGVVGGIAGGIGGWAGTYKLTELFDSNAVQNQK